MQSIGSGICMCCIYYNGAIGERDGVCKRHPPDINNKRPVVLFDDSCGEMSPIQYYENGEEK